MVFPAPVPPEIRILIRALTMQTRVSSIASVSVRFSIMLRDVMGSRPKRRMDRTGPSSASGGMMAFTREPSARRASTIGELSSTRRPTRDTMRSMICIKCASSLKLSPVISSFPARST